MRNGVRALRTERGLSQRQLAEAMSVSRQTINSIERERYTPRCRVVAFVIELARGRSGSPYSWLGAIAGLAYLAAVVVFRLRG
jgi:putative transcriptional regulator